MDMQYFFIKDTTNDQTITVLASDLETAQLFVTKNHGLNVTAQEPLFGGMGFTPAEAVKHGIPVGNTHTVEHYQPVTGKWHREETRENTTWATDSYTAQKLADGYLEQGYQARVVTL